MAYTPELNKIYSGTIRRIAWASGLPMTEVMRDIIDYVARIIDSKKVCETCRDMSFCEICPFQSKSFQG